MVRLMSVVVEMLVGNYQLAMEMLVMQSHCAVRERAKP